MLQWQAACTELSNFALLFAVRKSIHVYTTQVLSFSRSCLFMPAHSVLFLHNTYLYSIYNSSVTTPKALFVSKKFVNRLSRWVNLFLMSTLQNHGFSQYTNGNIRRLKFPLCLLKITIYSSFPRYRIKVLPQRINKALL